MHRLNMTKQQKGFKGDMAFISKPAEIAFRDFTVGQPHYLVITLTNVSNAFNSFNVLPLPPKIRVLLIKCRTTSKLSTIPKARYLQASAQISGSNSSLSSTRISFLSSLFWLRLAEFHTLLFAPLGRLSFGLIILR